MLQRTQALSTTEAEYVALCAATQDYVYLHQMLKEFDMEIGGAIPIPDDNTACINIARNPMTSQPVKHVDIRYHFVRTMVLEGRVALHHVPTYYQAADILTKPVETATFFRHRAKLMGLPSSP